MAEKNDSNTQSTEQPTLTREQIESHPAFRGMAKQLNDLRSEREQLAKKAEQERAEIEARKAAEAGDYQKAISELQRQAQAEIETARAEVEQHKRVAVESRLMAEMAVMGVQDSPVVRAGIVSLYWGQAEPADPAEFLKNLGDQLPRAGKQPLAAPPGVSPASRGGLPGIGDLIKRWISNDQTVREEINNLPQEKRNEFWALASERARQGKK